MKGALPTLQASSSTQLRPLPLMPQMCTPVSSRHVSQIIARCTFRSPQNALRFRSNTNSPSRKLPGSQNGSRLRIVFVAGTVAAMLAGVISYYNTLQYQSSFVTYKLVAKDEVSSTASIFHLEPVAADTENYKEVWKRGIWNVQFKQPQIQIVRAYTPLPPSQNIYNSKSQELRFLIRRDPYGEVSNYLHRLPLGADIELRGPNIEYQVTPDVRQVVFFAGGTGIAPALQIAHAMFGNSPSEKRDSSENMSSQRKLHILWASRKREDCLGGISDAPATEPMPPKPTWSGLLRKQKDKPAITVGEEKGLLVQELEDLKARYPGQVTVEYFVNAEGTWIDEDVVFRTLSRFDDKDFSKGYATAQEQRQILISGPNGFISYLAGPKEWRNGKEEQGPVSKIVAHAIAQNPHHVKVWKV